MTVFRESLKDVGIDPIFSLALDREVEQLHNTVRKQYIDKYKGQAVFDKCVMSELGRLQVIDAIRAVAVTVTGCCKGIKNGETGFAKDGDTVGIA